MNNLHKNRTCKQAVILKRTCFLNTSIHEIYNEENKNSCYLCVCCKPNIFYGNTNYKSTFAAKTIWIYNIKPMLSYLL